MAKNTNPFYAEYWTCINKSMPQLSSITPKCIPCINLTQQLPGKNPNVILFLFTVQFFYLTNRSDTKFIALPMDMDYIRIKLVRNQYVQEDVRSSGENPNTNKKVRHERAQEGRYHLCDRGRPVVQQPWFVDCYEELKGKIFDYLDP